LIYFNLWKLTAQLISITLNDLLIAANSFKTGSTVDRPLSKMAVHPIGSISLLDRPPAYLNNIISYKQNNAKQ